MNILSYIIQINAILFEICKITAEKRCTMIRSVDQYLPSHFTLTSELVINKFFANLLYKVQCTLYRASKV